MKPNNTVVENLNHYLSIDNPQYAFLIKGEWGVGKTHFIDSFIDEANNNNTETKIIKVSLFGIKNTSEINERIFQELHPILGSKSARMAGSLIKGALSLGLKLDLNLDGQSDSDFKATINGGDLKEYILGIKGEKKELVLALDDLERTKIEIKEILGFINELTEKKSQSYTHSK